MSATDEHGGELPRKNGNVTNYPGLGCQHCPASFFSGEKQSAHMKEKHPDKPRAAAWEDDTHRIEYIPGLTRQHPHLYTISDKQSGKYLSNMVLGHGGEVEAVETHPKFRRQGLATKLWETAQANTENGAPAPVHSSTRTRSGEAWAKKVGGEVPPRGGHLLSARQMRGMIDFSRQ
jgi:GNAT superfamily N-acetyltransferase